MLLFWIWAWVSFMSGLLGAARAEAVPASGLLDALLPVAGFAAGFVGPTLAILTLAGGAMMLAARHRHPTRSVGIRTSCDTTDRNEIDRCVWCDAEDVPGVATSARREVVVGGFVFRTLDEVGATDCRTCHDDLHRALLRARSDDPPLLRADGQELTDEQRAFRQYVHRIRAADDAETALEDGGHDE